MQLCIELTDLGKGKVGLMNLLTLISRSSPSFTLLIPPQSQVFLPGGQSPPWPGNQREGCDRFRPLKVGLAD